MQNAYGLVGYQENLKDCGTINLSSFKRVSAPFGNRCGLVIRTMKRGRKLRLADEESVRVVRDILLATLGFMEKTYQSCEQAWHGRHDDAFSIDMPMFASMWLVDLPKSLRACAEKLINGKHDPQLIRLARDQIIRRIPQLGVVEKLSRGKFTWEPEWAEPGALAAEIVRITPLTNMAFQKVAADPELRSCFWLLADFLWKELWHLHEAARTYYPLVWQEKPDAKFRQALWHALFTALVPSCIS